jgi:hypothetical protein
MERWTLWVLRVRLAHVVDEFGNDQAASEEARQGLPVRSSSDLELRQRRGDGGPRAQAQRRGVRPPAPPPPPGALCGCVQGEASAGIAASSWSALGTRPGLQSVRALTSPEGIPSLAIPDVAGGDVAACRE